MPKMPNAREDHRQAVFITRLDRIGIAHGAAWLDDRGNTGAGFSA
jgi:hypothetical protein